MGGLGWDRGGTEWVVCGGTEGGLNGSSPVGQRGGGETEWVVSGGTEGGLNGLSPVGQSRD